MHALHPAFSRVSFLKQFLMEHHFPTSQLPSAESTWLMSLSEDEARTEVQHSRGGLMG